MTVSEEKAYSSTPLQPIIRQGTDWPLALLKTQKVIGRVLLYAVLAFGAGIFVMPLIWMISTSLKPDGLVYNIPIVWIPPELQWHNYLNAWNTSVPPFTTFYANTLFITVMNII